MKSNMLPTTVQPIANEATLARDIGNVPLLLVVFFAVYLYTGYYTAFRRRKERRLARRNMLHRGP